MTVLVPGRAVVAVHPGPPVVVLAVEPSPPFPQVLPVTAVAISVPLAPDDAGDALVAETFLLAAGAVAAGAKEIART